MAEILLKVRLDDSTYKSQLAELEAQVGKIVSSTTKTPSMNVDSLQKSFANLLNTLKGAEGKYAVGTFQSLKTEISECLSRVKELNAEIGDSKPTKAQKAELAGLTKQLSELQAKFATVRAETAKLSTVQGTSSNAVKTLQKSYANLINSLNTVKNKYPAGTFDNLIAQAKEGLTATKNLNTEVGTSATLNEKQGATLQMLSGKYQQLAADVATVRAETEQNTSAVIKNGDSIGAMAKKFIIWQAAATLVMKPLQLIRDAISSINETLVETENAVVALRRVAGTSANADELYDLAQRYGQTFENVNEIALNFARSGMSWADTIKATEAALLALNVAELDATQASDGMIAIMQQFGYEASGLELIIDKLNISADNAAVSTEKLLTALQRTGSSAKNANLTLEETVGIITAISEATGRSGENIGTAVNSLIQFTTKESSLATFEKLGGDVAKVVEDYRVGAATVLDIWEELSKIIQSKNSSTEGILSGLFADDDWRSFNEELQTELGENFATVTEIYGTASTFRKNYFIALLNNLDQVQETMDDMNSAVGYSQRENEQYLDTYTAKTNALEAKWQDIVKDEEGFLGFKKALVDMGDDALTFLKNMGGISGVFKTALAVASPFLANWTLVFGAKAIKASVLGIGSFFKAIATGAATANQALGAIGIALGIIATISNVVGANKKKEEEKNNALVTEYEALRSTHIELETLSKRYEELTAKVDRTTEENQELYNVEDELIGIFGEKGTALQNITKGTEEYTEAVKNMTAAELNYLNEQRIAAAKAAKSNLENNRYTGDFWTFFSEWDSFAGPDTFYGKDIEKILNEAGIKTNSVDTGIFGKDNAFEISGVESTNDIVFLGNSLSEVLNAYKMYSKVRQALIDAYNAALKKGDFETANAIKNSKAWSGSESIIGKLESDVVSYLQNTTGVKEYEYKTAYGEPKNKQEYDKMLEWIIASIGADSYFDEMIKGYISTSGVFDEVLGDSDSTNDSVKDLKKTIESLDETSLSNLIAQFEKIRQTEAESVELEEKRKELLEAEQALLDAKQQRNVRVFNSAIGQWEQVANEKSIKEAEKNLEQARIEYEQQAYSSIISLLESEDKSTSAMVKLLAVIAETMPEISNKAQAILSEAGVDIPTYDSGGFLHGLGGIKATGRAETILPPGITEKIIEPSSNERFKNFTRSLGLLFGTSDKLEQFPRGVFVSNRGGDTTNNNNSRSYSINGIPIPAEIAQTHTLAELCDTMTLLE